MIEALISLLVLFVILAVIYFIIVKAVEYFGGPGIIAQIVGLILLLIFLLAVLRAFSGSPPWPLFRP